MLWSLFFRYVVIYALSETKVVENVLFPSLGDLYPPLPSLLPLIVPDPHSLKHGLKVRNMRLAGLPKQLKTVSCCSRCVATAFET